MNVQQKDHAGSYMENRKSDLYREKSHGIGTQKSFRDIYKWTALAAVLVPRIILCILSYPVCVFSDEVATISGGAFFAGLDWSGVVSHAGYYGTGMTAWTAPLFRITDDPVLLYRGILIFCTFIQSAVVLIAYWLLNNYLKISSQRAACLISVVCAYFVFTRANVVFNEHGLTVITWVTAWILAKLDINSENRRKKAGFTLLLILTFSYAMSLHTRALTYWLALGVLLLGYFWIYRKWLVSMPLCIAGGAAGYLLSQLYASFIRNRIWRLDQGESVINSEIAIGSVWKELLDFHNWKAWLNIIMGQLHTVGIVTGGLFLIFLLMFLSFLGKRLLFPGKYREESSTDKKAVPLLLFFGTAAAATIAAQSLLWLDSSIQVVNAGADNNLYGSKAYGYLRYFGVYCGPLLMIGFYYLYAMRERVLVFFKWGLAALGILEVYWYVCIFPYIARTSQIGVAEYYCAFSLDDLKNGVTPRTLIPASVVMFLVFFISWISLKRKKGWIAIASVGVLLVHTYFFFGIVMEKGWSDGYYEAYGNVYGIIKEAENYVELPRQIYAENTWDITNHQYYYEYQMLLNRYEIIPERPPEELAEAVAFSNNTYSEDHFADWTQRGYAYAQISEYVMLFVKGEELQTAFERAGVSLMG